MMKRLKENYALIAGVLLPLALIAVFFVAGNMRLSTVPDPMYDAVFATNYSERSVNNPYKIGLDGGKILIRFRQPREGKALQHLRDPIIYVFDHANPEARKVDIDFGNIVGGQVVDPDLDDLNKRKISSSSLSPDGYRFSFRPRNGGGGLIRGLFGGSNRLRSNYALVKDGRVIPVVGPEALWNAHFIGWIEK